jgi:host factor-I protein
VAIELETSLPSVRKFQAYVKDKTQIEVKLSTGDAISGTMLWIDPMYFCLVDAQQKQLVVACSSIVYIKPLG